MIYLDNASTSFFKPRCVKKIVKKGLNCYTANASRSGHKYAQKASMKILKVRELFAKIFNCSFDRVIFTSGCTESLNLAILGSVKIGGHIIATCYEHNSTLRVLEHLKNEGKISYTIVYPNSFGEIEPKAIEKEIIDKTYMIITNHISNVTGQEQDIFTIGKIAKKYGLLFLVDGAQSVGHKYIDMRKCNISYLAIAGHKGVLGLQGVGTLCVGDKANLKPIKFGGTGSYSESLTQPKDFPEGFESGTFSAINIISMGKGLEYSYSRLILINDKILKLSKYLYTELIKLKNIMCYSCNGYVNGVISFNVLDKSPQEVATILNDKYNIAVRSGLACAPLVHNYLGTLKIGGVVRVSIGFGNKMRDVKKFVKAIKSIAG